MIGEIVKYILDCGFFMQFAYDDATENIYNFKIWKYYKREMFQCSFAFHCFEMSHVKDKSILFMETDKYLKQVNDAISQRRLIDSTFKQEMKEP